MTTQLSSSFTSFPCFSLSEVEKIVETHFGIRTKAHNLVGYSDQNLHLQDEKGNEYTLKISHQNTQKNALILQNTAISFLYGKVEGLCLPYIYPNKAGENIISVEDEQGISYFMRLLSWVKGSLWEHIFPHSIEVRRELGQKLAKMDTLLQDFTPPVSQNLSRKWDILNVIWVLDELNNIKNEADREIMIHFITNYQADIFPYIEVFRKGMIQNDANTFNILVEYVDSTQKVVGLIDFGELMESKVVCELAISCAYLSMNYDNPLPIAAQIIKGFHSVFPLNDREMRAIFPLMANRAIISVMYSAINRKNGLKSDYLYVSEKPGWELLRKMRHISPEVAYTYFKEVIENE